MLTCEEHITFSRRPILIYIPHQIFINEVTDQVVLTVIRAVNSGQSWSCTNGVSSVADLQSAGIATILPTHVIAGEGLEPPTFCV